MQELSEIVDAPSHDSGPFRNKTLVMFEHLMWVISRGLLVCFVVALAFALKVPFERLIERDAFAEWERTHKSEISEQLDILENISRSAKSFEVQFVDTSRVVGEYRSLLDADNRSRAQQHLQVTDTAIKELRSVFANRKALLSKEVEGDIIDLLATGERGLKLLHEVVDNPSMSNSVSFAAHLELTHRCVSSIVEYQKIYIATGGHVLS